MNMSRRRRDAVIKRFPFMLPVHATEKNPALLARIIEASSNPGDLVLDCFAGSGTTLAAASQLNRRWIGIDNSIEAISTTLRRFAKGLEPMGDFVSKQETQERSIQKPLLWESSEKLTEEVEGDKLASKNGNHMINNFSLKSIESFAGDLDNVLQQWLEWQR